MGKGNAQKIIEILDIRPEWCGGCFKFDISPEQLNKLNKLGLIGLGERQNDGPTVKKFIEFCERFSLNQFDTSLEVYLINDSRSDSRFTVEGIRTTATKELLLVFHEFAEGADEFENEDGKLRAWWD